MTAIASRVENRTQYDLGSSPSKSRLPGTSSFANTSFLSPSGHGQYPNPKVAGRLFYFATLFPCALLLLIAAASLARTPRHVFGNAHFATEAGLRKAGLRARRGQEVYLFNPLLEEGRTSCYKPLDFVSRDPARRINDVQKITANVLPTPHSSNPIWANEGRDLLEGLILYLMDTGGQVTFGEVSRLTKKGVRPRACVFLR